MQYTKKMVLMPQDVARVVHATNQDKTPSRLHQLDEAMKNTLDRKDLTLYEKVDLYHQILQRYLDAEKTVGEPIALRVMSDTTTTMDQSQSQTTTPINKDQSSKEEPNYQLIKHFPKSIKNKAKLLLDRIHHQRLSDHEPTIDWNLKGELIYEGNPVVGSNITDFILDLLQSRKDFKPIGWQQIMRGLMTINFPEAYVGNVTRRQYMHQLKDPPARLLPTPPGKRNSRRRSSPARPMSKRHKWLKWEAL